MQSRRAVRLALVLALGLASVGVAEAASAASVTGTIRLDPATSQVDNGATVNITVISNTSVPTSGVSASITFNKSILQVTALQRGSAWAGAPLFIAGDAAAIAKANQKGVLQAVAASFFPPTSVPAGDQQFVTVTFKAIACGTVTLTVPIGRVDSAMLDGRSSSYGNAIPVKSTGATITVCQGGGASGSPGVPGSGVPGDSGLPGPSGSLDPNASPSATGDTSSPGPSPSDSGTLAAAASSLPGDGSAGGGVAGGTAATEQNSWLTFALAALAVSAAGLAVLIIVLTIVAIAAASVGAIVVIRVWRRSAAREAAIRATSAASTADDGVEAISEAPPAAIPASADASAAAGDNLPTLAATPANAS